MRRHVSRVRRGRFCAALCLGTTLLFGAGCFGRSEEEIQAEFNAFVAAHNQCSKTEECVLASAGCPLGCSAAVNVQSQSLVESKARELVDEYQKGGRRCEYECAAVKAGCVEGHCQAVAE